MKLLSAYISGFLGLLMMAATLLPSLHAFEHDLSSHKDNNSHQVVNFIKSSLDCDLCDFNFSSIDTPSYFEDDFHFPLKKSVYTISIAQTVYLFSNNTFSLRAPPAVIA